MRTVKSYQDHWNFKLRVYDQDKDREIEMYIKQ